MFFKKLLLDKKFLAGALGIAVLVAGFWAIQTQTTEAAVTEKEFIRIKIDPISSLTDSQLWNFFATDDGTFDEFNVTSTSYTTSTVTYDCGLLLTQEFGGVVDDDDYILWAKKGTILGKGISLFADVTDYEKCCTENNINGNACTINTSGDCETKVYTASDYIFQKKYGILDETKCGSDSRGAPCNNNSSTCCALSENQATKKYIFKDEAICNDAGKWAFCDAGNATTSNGASNYICKSGAWAKCTNVDCTTFVLPPVVPPAGGGIIEFRSPSKFTELMDLVGSLVNALSYLALAVAVLMLVIAGFIFLTAGGDPNRVTIAKTLILYTIVALLIIILAKAIAGALKYAVS